MKIKSLIVALAALVASSTAFAQEDLTALWNKAAGFVNAKNNTKYAAGNAGKNGAESDQRTLEYLDNETGYFHFVTSPIL